MYPHRRYPETRQTTPAAEMDLVLSLYPLETAETPKYVMSSK